MLTALLVAATVSVAATTTDLSDLVAAVGGDRVSVASLTNPRDDPHAHQISPGQLVRLRDAQLLVRVGLDHEPWLGRAVAALGRRPPDLDASRGIDLIGTETPRLRAEPAAHVHAFGNTHYWLDPANAEAITWHIAERLGALDPDGRAVYEANRTRFIARLGSARARWEAALRPFAGRRVVAFHDTWAYFARRFGIVVAATVEEQPAVPPSAAHVARLVERMRAAGVRVIIGEPAAPMALLLRIAEQAHGLVTILAPSVGADPEATDYVTLLDVNVRRLAAALAVP